MYIHGIPCRLMNSATNGFCGKRLILTAWQQYRPLQIVLGYFLSILTWLIPKDRNLLITGKY